MKRRDMLGIIAVFPAVIAVRSSFAAETYQPNLKQFTSLFDGKTLAGWNKLTTYSGDDGKWEVIKGLSRATSGRKERAGFW